MILLACSFLPTTYFCMSNHLTNYSLQLVLSTGSGVNGFTLDPSLGEFILTHPDIKVSVAVDCCIHIFENHESFHLLFACLSRVF